MRFREFHGRRKKQFEGARAGIECLRGANAVAPLVGKCWNSLKTGPPPVLHFIDFDAILMEFHGFQENQKIANVGGRVRANADLGIHCDPEMDHSGCPDSACLCIWTTFSPKAFPFCENQEFARIAFDPSRKPTIRKHDLSISGSQWIPRKQSG